MSRVFISYRREDSAGYAGRLNADLRRLFGADKFFMDVAGSIAPGDDFEKAIEESMASCDVVIAVIGRNWLDILNERDKKENTKDYVRLEIAAALKRGVRVIPVLVGQASMPPQQAMPDDLEGIAGRQAVELSDSRWEYDFSKLAETLRSLLREKKAAAFWWRSAVAGVAAAGVVGGFLAYQSYGPPARDVVSAAEELATAVEAEPATPVEAESSTVKRTTMPPGTGLLFADGRMTSGTGVARDIWWNRREIVPARRMYSLGKLSDVRDVGQIATGEFESGAFVPGAGEGYAVEVRSESSIRHAVIKVVSVQDELTLEWIFPYEGQVRGL
jgi:hypothetical protein